MDRIARRIEHTRESYDLTTLTRRLIRGRLRYGPERSSPLASPAANVEQVRFWDPAGAWHPGDRVIFAVPVSRDQLRSYIPAVGEILKVQGNGVVVSVDGDRTTRIYGTASRVRENESLAQWRTSVEDLVEALGTREDEVSAVDYVFWQHGQRIVSRLLAALREDHRFTTLNGQWFLVDLVDRPSDEALRALAWAMLTDGVIAASPLTLLPLLPTPLVEGPAGIFGLTLAMRERPDLFTIRNAGPRTRWSLAGPPPGDYTSRLAAYDPRTHDILCEPGEPLAPNTVQRLWELDLLRVVLER
jgi:hypothetical protein